MNVKMAKNFSKKKSENNGLKWNKLEQTGTLAPIKKFSVPYEQKSQKIAKIFN